MSGYWIFAFGCVVGGCVGLLLAALLSAAHRGEEKMEAYYYGINVGPSFVSESAPGSKETWEKAFKPPGSA